MTFTVVKCRLGLMMSKCEQHNEKDRTVSGGFIDPLVFVIFAVNHFVKRAARAKSNTEQLEICIQRFTEGQPEISSNGQSAFYVHSQISPKICIFLFSLMSYFFGE